MRPPDLPGGNAPATRRTSVHRTAWSCFNEAAGFTRRKLYADDKTCTTKLSWNLASMRPPDLPGGNMIYICWTEQLFT